MMDHFDLAILTSLEQDGRQSFSTIAEQIALSKTPCWTRVQNLQDCGTIKGYRAIVDPQALGLRLTAFVQVTVEFGSHQAFERSVRDHPAIIECYTTAGQADYMLQLITSDVERLDSLLREELSRLPGVQRFSTIICMKRIKDNGPLTRAATALRDARS